MKRAFAVAITGGVLVASLGFAPASGAGCKKFRPSLSASQSGQHDEAREAPVRLLTRRMTGDHPLVIEYKHGPGLDLGSDYDVIVPDGQFFNFQIRSAARFTTLNVRAEWAAPSLYDVDLFLYNAAGSEVASSVAWNPVTEMISDNDDGDGWEQILDVGVRNCQSFTLESEGAVTVDVPVTLKVWLD